MEYLIAALLGAIQGLTEFLPISSSGHLVIFQSLLGVQEGELLLDTILHLGTALAIFIVFRKDITGLALNAFAGQAEKKKSAWAYIGYLVIATIPAGVAGVLFNDYFESLFSNPQSAGGMLLVTATLLFVSATRKSDGGEMTLLKAVVIGAVQAAAIIPGISRSGSTITIALLIGVSRTEAGRFSFLMALPAICGAALLQARKIESLSVHPLPLMVGFIISIVTGIIALKLLLKFVQQGKLHFFGFYCVIVGLLGLIFL